MTNTMTSNWGQKHKYSEFGHPRFRKIDVYKKEKCQNAELVVDKL